MLKILMTTGVDAMYSFAPASTFQTWPMKKNKMQWKIIKITPKTQLLGTTREFWVYLVSSHPSSLLPFPLFLSNFFYYLTPFCQLRAFISAQGSGAPSRRRDEKGLWRSWTCGELDGKHPKSVSTRARRVERTGHHMLLRLKYFPCLLISIQDEEWVREGGRDGMFLCLSLLSQSCPAARLSHSSSQSFNLLSGFTYLI